MDSKSNPTTRSTAMRKLRREAMFDTGYVGREGSSKQWQFTSGQSEDCPFYSVGYLYNSTCLYICGLINKLTIGKWSVPMVRAEMTPL